jgi:hypothetical protein
MHWLAEYSPNQHRAAKSNSALPLLSRRHDGVKKGDASRGIIVSPLLGIFTACGTSAAASGARRDHGAMRFGCTCRNLTLSLLLCACGTSLTAGGDNPLPQHVAPGATNAHVSLSRPRSDELLSASGPDRLIEINVLVGGKVHLEIRDPKSGRVLGREDVSATTLGLQKIRVAHWGTIQLAALPGTVEVVANGSVIGRRRIGLSLFVVGQSNSANWQCANCPSAPVISNIQRVAVFADPTVPPMPGPNDDVFTNAVPAYPLPPLGAGQWRSLSSWGQRYLPIANGRLQSVWPAVADRLAEHYPNLGVAIASVGVGDTAIAQWADEGYLYQRFGYLSQIWNLDLILWVQGERDTMDGTSTADYEYTLDSIRKRSLQDFPLSGGTSRPWMLFLTTGGSLGCARVTASGQQNVRAAIGNLVAQYPSEFVMGPDIDALPHHCHFDTEAEFQRAVSAIAARLISFFGD